MYDEAAWVQRRPFSADGLAAEVGDSSQKPALGERFGRYTLLENIGKGGMAEIFRAVASGVQGFQRVFVLKRILQEKCASREFIDMFVSEARISALLNHPNIVQIYDFGQINGSYFLTMEYLRGKDLLSVMRQLRASGKYMPPGLAAFIAHEVASGLHYAHSLKQVGGRTLNIVHRDVSPSNVMLLRAGGVKLLDFGIAKSATEAKTAGLNTQNGLIKGKLSYLSPEQVRGTELDGRSDVFSLGVVLWEMLTGRRLFYDKSEFETMKNVLERPVPPPSTQRPDVPMPLDYIVVRALERDLDRRYPTAKMMADELQAYLEDTRFASGALPKLLDDLFGEDEGQFEAQVPSAFAPPARTPSMLAVPAVDMPSLDSGARAATQAAKDDGHTSGPSSGSVPPLPLPALLAAPAARRSRRTTLTAGAGLGLALAVALVVSLRKPTPPRTASAPAPVAAPASAPPVAAPPPPPAPPPAPSTVNLRVDSDPPGADVRDGTGRALGHTPAELTVPRAQGHLLLVLSRPGFAESRYEIATDRDVAALVTLKKLEPPPPAATARAGRKPRPAAPAGAESGKGDGKVKEAISIDPFREASTGQR